ncbi:MAG: TetR/AcrR family transcriptional regulator [Lachnospiraceae bacterium]|nr:TetR/AcrR family transcriptional regulator [Lachnospiraceae bacterium]
MPPKPKITRDMILDAAMEIAREEGAENINARTVSKKLNCSTQPVMYQFATIEELKKAVYAKVDRYHTEYLMNMEGQQKGIMLGIGLNYIRFAIKEPNLFRFLFQSGFAVANSLLEMIDSEELKPVLTVMQEAMAMDMEQTKEVFLTIALFAHGYASIIANNSLEYDEELIAVHLERAYRGAVLAVQAETGSTDITIS